MMKTSAFAVAIFGLTAVAIPAAAQARPPVAQRSANIEARIDHGIRTGRLTRPEARRLTAEYGQLRRLEARYRRDGLNQWERHDLDRRYDALAARVRVDRNDRQYRRG